jgi:hypothetical protein
VDPAKKAVAPGRAERSANSQTQTGNNIHVIVA